MSDKELVERLLDFDKVTVGDARDAALRIEALLNLNEALVELMDDRDAKLETLTAERDDYAFRLAAAYNIYSEMHVELEALTEQLEAARADAKEAEAYAEELAGDQVDLCRQLIAAEDKLAKAVSIAKRVTSFEDNTEELAECGCARCKAHLDLRALLAEIEGEKGCETNSPAPV
jgi:chromosome segregation ATPase